MLNDILLRLFVAMQGRFQRETAQGALEYMAMVVAMVILIYAGFTIAGVKIKEEASCFVSTVLGSSTC